MRRFNVMLGFSVPPSYSATVDAESVVEAVKVVTAQSKLEGFGKVVKTSVKEVPCESPA